MSQDRRARIEDLFHRARQVDASDRAAWLERECGPDLELRHEIETLLEHQADPDDDFLARPAVAPVEDATLLDSVSSFRILEHLSDDELGTLYRADQTRPISRRVTLRVVRPQTDAHQVLTRFSRIKAALAALDHPGLGRIHEAGMTGDGRAWFAMEVVEGEPITDFAGRRRLSSQQRAQLLLQVDDALHYAHAAGLAHTGLAATRVLVDARGGTQVVKLTELGVVGMVTGDTDATPRADLDALEALRRRLLDTKRWAG